VNVIRQDFKSLRLAIAAAGMLVLVGSGLVAGTQYYLSEARKAWEAARLQRQQAQQRLAQVAEEEKEIRENLVHYRRMMEHGMGSEENRLDLIDAIARIKNERRLFEIRYNIEAQKPLDYPGIVRATPVDFVGSRMKLEMLLLHEEDLLKFLTDLDATGKAYVSVRQCSVLRVDRGGVAPGSVVPRLRSECLIDLIALKQVKPA
jgi:hypothetical protein